MYNTGMAHNPISLKRELIPTAIIDKPPSCRQVRLRPRPRVFGSRRQMPIAAKHE
jgi:hypothetical protein